MADIIDLLIEDHEEFKRLFNDYASDPEKCFQHLKRDLTMHTRLEETVLYPEIEKYAAEEVEHAKKEHDKADALVATLGKDIHNAGAYNALKDAVLHHVKEEEEDLFPVTRDTLGAEKLQEMGDEGAKVKAEILEQLS